MLKNFVLLCLLGLVAADIGYNYQSASSTVPQYDQAPAATHQHQTHAAPAHHQEYEKQYYYFNAPEEHSNPEDAAALQKALSSVKRRQQVIFIKNPENKAYEKALQNLVANAVNQKTHIYVLNKEPDYAGLAKKFQNVQQATHHKPEVHFVKYKTPEDAHHAQQTITQQYGGGNVHQGAASTLDYSTAPAANTPVAKTYANKFAPGGIDVRAGTSYIPPALLRSRFV